MHLFLMFTLLPGALQAPGISQRMVKSQPALTALEIFPPDIHLAATPVDYRCRRPWRWSK